MTPSELNATIPGPRETLVQQMVEMSVVEDCVAPLRDLREQVAALPDDHPALAAYAEAVEAARRANTKAPSDLVWNRIIHCARRRGGAESLLADLKKEFDAAPIMCERGRVLAARPDVKELMAGKGSVRISWSGGKGVFCIWKRGGPPSNEVTVNLRDMEEARSLSMYLWQSGWRDAPATCT